MGYCETVASAVYGLAALLAATHAAGPGHHDRLAVLPVVSPDRTVSESDIHRAVGRGIGRRMGVQLLSAEEMFVANQEDLVARVRDCGPDIACMASRMRQFRARLGLVVVYDGTISPAVLGLQLIDTDAGRSVAQTIDELPDREHLLAVISARASELLAQAGYVESGRLTVLVDPPAAQVRLKNGLEPDRGSLNVFTLGPGTYAITAEHPGFDAATTTARVHSGRDTQVKLELAAESSVWTSPWLWIAVGVVVVAAATAGAIVASQPETRICFSTPERPCDN